MKNVLFLCTGNSCRSIMAEALLNHYGSGTFSAQSAGSFPTGTVHPMSLETLACQGIQTHGYRSKSWDELQATAFDIVITVCDNAASESCPVFPGRSVKAHWGVPDPAKFVGSPEATRAEFSRVCDMLKRRVKALVALPIATLDHAALQTSLEHIGKQP